MSATDHLVTPPAEVVTETVSKSVDLIDNFIGPDSAWFWTMVQAFAVSLTLGLILRQLRLQRMANMNNSLHEFDRRWTSPNMIYWRAQVCSNPAHSRVIPTDADDAVLVFFEDLGIQVKLGILNKTLVWETYSAYIEHYWPILKPVIEEQWNRGDKTIYENFSSLNAHMAKIARARKVKHEKTREELNRFAAGEASRQPINLVAPNHVQPHTNTPLNPAGQTTNTAVTQTDPISVTEANQTNHAP